MNWYFPNTTEFKRFNLLKSLAVIFVELYLELMNMCTSYDDYLSQIITEIVRLLIQAFNKPCHPSRQGKEPDISKQQNYHEI